MTAFVFTAAILDLRLPVARDGIGISTVGFIDPENRGPGSHWNFDPMLLFDGIYSAHVDVSKTIMREYVTPYRTRDMPVVCSDPLGASRQ